MAKKEFLFHGKKFEEIKSLSLEAFAAMLPSRQRRCIKRMLAATDKDARRTLYKDIKKNAGGKVKTHSRDFVILPEMVGMTVGIHTGKEFKDLIITEKMLGRFLGEFANTRTFSQHSAPGIGASRSTKFVSVRA
jgi:small subunit ribosomal protein S19